MNFINDFLALFNNTAVAVPVAFAFGTAIGSFLNVLIWRLPREEKPNGRSRCPNCSHSLRWYDLIPVISFILARGRCRYCNQPISLRYPLIELVTGILFALAIWVFPPADIPAILNFVIAIFFIAVCIVVFAVDFEHYLILDKVVFPAMAVILGLLILTDLASGTTSSTIIGLLSALGAMIPFWLIWFVSGGKWMGFGDVKFIALMGLALGFPGVVIALFVSVFAGAFVGVILIVAGRKQMNSKMPFGTFLAAAAILAMLFGENLWNAYWSLFVI